MISLSYNFKEYIFSGTGSSCQEAHHIVNGYKIANPFHFKNKAHHRAYYLALALAQRKPSFTHTQRMGDIVVSRAGPIFMTTAECIDILVFEIPPEIELDYTAKNPSKVARDAMAYVPSFFEPGVVVLDHRTKPRKLYYLEIKNPAN